MDCFSIPCLQSHLLFILFAPVFLIVQVMLVLNSTHSVFLTSPAQASITHLAMDCFTIYISLLQSPHFILPWSCGYARGGKACVELYRLSVFFNITSTGLHHFIMDYFTVFHSFNHLLFYSPLLLAF